MRMLITKVVSESDLKAVSDRGWEFDVVPALDITPVFLSQHVTPADAWVISSRNSMPYLLANVSEPAPVILVVGTWLREQVLRVFPNADVKAFPAMSVLAAAVVAAGYKSIVYFCADHHRHELAEAAEAAHFNITEIVTHQSRKTNPVLSHHYDALVVLSPRSMESLLDHNNFERSVVVGCLGATTEAFVHSAGYANTLCASVPDAKILITETLDFANRNILFNSNR